MVRFWYSESKFNSLFENTLQAYKTLYFVYYIDSLIINGKKKFKAEIRYAHSARVLHKSRELTICLRGSKVIKVKYYSKKWKAKDWAYKMFCRERGIEFKSLHTPTKRNHLLTSTILQRFCCPACSRNFSLRIGKNTSLIKCPACKTEIMTFTGGKTEQRQFGRKILFKEETV